MTTHKAQAVHGELARGLQIAGLLIAGSLALRLLSPNVISPEVAQRLAGVCMGVVVVIYANSIPKALAPLTSMQCDLRREQASRRSAGWILTLGGAGYLLTWIVVPLPSVHVVSTAMLGSAVLVVISLLTWPRLTGANK